MALSPLALACLKGDGNVVKVLLAQGTEVNAFSTRGNTPAMIAFRFGHFDIVKLLIHVSGFDYFSRNRFGVPVPVLIASNFDIFDVFLENKLNNPEIEKIFLQILYSCCRYNNIEALKVLLCSNVVPEQDKRLDQYMAYTLIQNGNFESVNFIFELSKSTPSIDYSNLHSPATEKGLIEYFQLFPTKISNYPIVMRTALRQCQKKILDHLQSVEPDFFDEYLLEALRTVSKKASSNNIDFLLNIAMKKFPTDDQIFINLALSAIKHDKFEIFKTITSCKVFKTALVGFATSAAKFNRLNVLKLILSKNTKKGNSKIIKILLSMSPQDQDIIKLELLESKDP